MSSSKPVKPIDPRNCTHTPYPVDATTRRALGRLGLALPRLSNALRIIAFGAAEASPDALSKLAQEAIRSPQLFADETMAARCCGLSVKAFLNHDFGKGLEFWSMAIMFQEIHNITDAMMPPSKTAGGPFTKAEVFFQDALPRAFDDDPCHEVTSWGTPAILWPRSWKFPPHENMPMEKFVRGLKQGMSESRLLRSLQKVVPCSCLDAEDPLKLGANRAANDKTVHVGKSVPLTTKAVSYLAECEECEKTNCVLLRCSGCRLVRYCSKECQKKHWKEVHKRICGKQPLWWGRVARVKNGKLVK